MPSAEIITSRLLEKRLANTPENARDLQCSKTTRIPLYKEQNPIDYWLLIVCVSHRMPKIKQNRLQMIRIEN